MEKSKFDKLYLTYSEFGIAMDRISNTAKQYHDIKPYNIVIGPPRGGLCMAVHLSHYLEIPLLCSINSYTDIEKKHILLVDDIADTGNTLQYYKRIFENFGITFNIITWHYKKRSTVIPDCYLDEVPNNTWIVYPWEKDDIPDKEYFK